MVFLDAQIKNVSESIMSGSDNLNKWLLMPSGPDDFLLSSLDIYLPSSGMEICGMTNVSCPRVFRSQNSYRIFEHSDKSDRGFAKINVLPKKGSGY